MDFINLSVENVFRYDMRRFLVNTVKVLVVFSTRALLWVYSLILNVSSFNAAWKKPQTLPKIKFEFYNRSAEELRDLLISRQITSRQIVEAYINRVKEVDVILNSVVENRFEGALKDAEEVDNLIAKTDDVKMLFGVQPLLGIPFTVKENLAVKGMKHSSSRTRVPTKKAESDAGAVERLRRFGGIPLLVSNAPELCLNMETVSKKNGRTLNPYDTTRTTGGSSGGEAALLGAGASVIGLGSDIAGSIRFPSMFCGVLDTSQLQVTYPSKATFLIPKTQCSTITLPLAPWPNELLI
uniref:Fatty-acid amide hydrolase 2 n=1 Tax=Lygus hesperus TaxID=30085 RepID=A0A0A9W8F4_LYGHE